MSSGNPQSICIRTELGRSKHTAQTAHRMCFARLCIPQLTLRMCPRPKAHYRGTRSSLLCSHTRHHCCMASSSTHPHQWHSSHPPSPCHMCTCRHQTQLHRPPNADTAVKCIHHKTPRKLHRRSHPHSHRRSHPRNRRRFRRSGMACRHTHRRRSRSCLLPIPLHKCTCRCRRSRHRWPRSDMVLNRTPLLLFRSYHRRTQQGNRTDTKQDSHCTRHRLGMAARDRCRRRCRS
eukprot:SAG11_NODE_3916_length_2150_cov_1.076060_1_plen_233_part_00